MPEGPLEPKEDTTMSLMPEAAAACALWAPLDLRIPQRLRTATFGLG